MEFFYGIFDDDEKRALKFLNNEISRIKKVRERKSYQET